MAPRVRLRTILAPALGTILLLGNQLYAPYCGDQEHPVVVYDHTPTRERAGPEKFLAGYRG